METKVYVVSDPIAINFLVEDDLEGLKEYLESDDLLDFPLPEIFATQEEAMAFCEGLGYGTDDEAIPTRYPLRSCEPVDAPYIEAIEEY